VARPATECAVALRPHKGRVEAAALRIREAEALPAQVLFEDAVLFPQASDHLKLTTIHPSREGDEQNPPSDVVHPPSLLATAALR
jgi:hypothetical protein